MASILFVWCLPSSDAPQTTRTRLDEILGRGTPPRLLERPPTGERKEAPPQQPISRQDQAKPASAKGEAGGDVTSCLD